MSDLTPEQLADPRFDLKAYIDSTLLVELQRRVDEEARQDERRILYGTGDRSAPRGLLNDRHNRT